jgi:Protein of unknown function (DUF3800)
MAFHPPIIFFDEDEVVLAHLYAYFDETGGISSNRPVLVYGGFVDGHVHWTEFYNRWNELLRNYRIQKFRAVEALRYSQSYGTMKPGTAKERAADIIPFIRAISEILEMGVCVAVDINAYMSADPIIRDSFSQDPHYFAFYQLIVAMLRHYEIPRRYEIGIICDDEQQKSIRCYEMLKKMKLAYPEVKERVTSICFADDAGFPPLQCADLFAYISRREAEKRFFGMPYEYEELFSEFTRVAPDTGKHLHFISPFNDREALDKLAEELRKAT